MLQYRGEIDGLRALAILPVVLFHAGFSWLGGGYVGVDVFFVISGYLITLLIYQDVQADRFSVVTFYERRIKRLFPALFVMAAVCSLVAYQIFLPYDLEDYFGNLASVFNFTSNIHFYIHSGYFDPSSELNPLLHTWSLTVEEQYYFVFPALMLLLWKGGKTAVWSGVLLLTVISFVLAEWRLETKPMAAFYLLYARGWELLLGSLCALLVVDTRFRNHIPNWLADTLSWLGLVMILVAVFGFSAATPVPGRYTLIPTMGTVLIILFCHTSLSSGKLLSNRLLVGVGLISYSTYLWHQPLLAFYRYLEGEHLTLIAASVLSLVSFVCGYLSWRFVEKPLRYGKWGWLTRKQLFSRAAVLGVGLFALGIYGEQQEGFPQRLDAEVRSIYQTPVHYGQVESCFITKESRFADDCLAAQGDAAKTGESKRALIVGDSHAASLFPELKQQMAADGWQLSMLAYARCVPMIAEKQLQPFRSQSGFLSKHITSRCEQVKQNFGEQLAGQSFDRIIVLNHYNNWLGAYNQRSFDEFWQLYVSELLRLFDRDKLLVLGPLPAWTEDLPRLIVEDYASGGDFTAPSNKGLYDDKGWLENFLKQELHKVGGRYLSTTEAFCSSAGCQRVMLNKAGQQIAIAFDDTHLSQVGAEYLSQYIVSQSLPAALASE